MQWSPDNISVKNSGKFFFFFYIQNLFLVHEYGGGSFCIGDDNSVYISSKNDIYQLIKPKFYRHIVCAEEEGQDYRYADLFLYKNFLFSVQERHINSKTEPENVLVKINTDDKKITILVKKLMFN